MKDSHRIPVLPLLALALAACGQPAPDGFDLERLFLDVFAPRPGESVLFIVDTPTPDSPDYAAWEERRAMAESWRSTIAGMQDELGITVLPLMRYPATGAHNAPLPEAGELGGQAVSFAEILGQTDIAIAMTEFSATAPLIGYAAANPQLRVASMPMVSRSMQSTALAADYASMGEGCRLLRHRLDRAVGAEVEFSTGHQIYFDLRHRTAEVDDGRLDGRPGSARVINLPSGEAFIAPYEGELEGDPSKTQGMIPVALSGQAPEQGYVIAMVQGNRIVDVRDSGSNPEEAADARQFLEQDPALRNVAELGLGCNPSAVVTGNVLEDEKVVGLHWALGRSDHIGGTVGPEDFSSPELVTHMDWVYPSGGAIEVTSLILEYEDGTRHVMIEDGENLLLAEAPSLAEAWGPLRLIWLLVAAGCWSWVAWDSERYDWPSPSRKFLWAGAALALGVVGLGLYRRARPGARRPDHGPPHP